MKKKIITAMTILLIGLISINKVYADEKFNYSSSLWSYTYSNPTTDCNNNLRNCGINGYVGNIELNTTKNVNYVNTLRFYTYATDNNKFKSSNYYNLKFEICQTEKDFNKIKSRGRGYAWGYNSNNAATGSTAGDPTQFTYKIDDKVEDNKCYYLTFSVKPPIDSRYLGFYFTYTGYGDNINATVIPDVDYFNSTGGTINVKSLNVTYSQDVNATINNSTNQIINNNNKNSQQIINNQNQNTQEIIDNQNQNTEDIINSQNQNAKEQISSQKVCKTIKIDRKNVIIEKKILKDNGQLEDSNTTWGVTDFYEIDSKLSEVNILQSFTTTSKQCFYKKDKSVISCFVADTTGTIAIPNEARYIRFSISVGNNLPQFELKECKNGNQAIQDTINQKHEYNNNPNRDTTAENNELTSYEQQEQQLLNSLNLNIEDAEVTINGNASSFIWEIINRIRETSGKIVLLFTSILSLGIIKMILGR